MNKKLVICLYITSVIFSLEIFWDLGVGITNFKTQSLTQDIQASTFHRLEGTKKYYNRDYHTALFHFEQLQAPERFSVLYEYIDCYFLLGQYNKALDVLEAFGNHELSDNVLYLKSKIYLQLNLYNESLNCLLYIKKHFLDSEYSDILLFEIEKINLLRHE
tara:strand:+ start:1193 stop:1675 length:483 start_codon:yes stop_codon:yes gene_type:complete